MSARDRHLALLYAKAAEQIDEGLAAFVKAHVALGGEHPERAKFIEVLNLCALAARQKEIEHRLNVQNHFAGLSGNPALRVVK